MEEGLDSSGERGDPCEVCRRGPRGRARLRQGRGWGTVGDPGGLVVTSSHVVEGAVSVGVRLGDGRSVVAEGVGREPPTAGAFGSIGSYGTFVAYGSVVLVVYPDCGSV